MRIPNFKTWILAVASIASMSHADAEERLLVIGDATWGGWSLDRSAVMVKQSDSPEIFTYTGYLNANKEFKFLTEAQWDKREYRNASSDPYILGQGNLRQGGDDTKFKVSESANYTISCNLTDMTLSVTKAAYQDAPILHDVLYLVGDATPGGWALGNASPLAQSASNPFLFTGRVTLTNAGDNRTATFKIATNCHGGYDEQKFFFRDATDANRLSEDGTDDRQWSVPEPGTYDVAVDLAGMTIGMVNADSSKRLCWYEPQDAAPTDQITLYYNAKLGNGELAGYTGDVYAHCGAITDESVDFSDWKHSSGWGDNNTKYRLTRSASDPDLYTLQFTPMTFFPLTEGENLTGLAFVMRNADGSRCGRAADDGDIVAQFVNGSTSAPSRPLGRVLSWNGEGPSVTVNTENGTLELTAFGPGVIKVFTRINGQSRPERRSISVCALPEGNLTATDCGDHIELSTGTVTVSVSKADSRVTFADASGNVKLREEGGLDNSTFPRTVSFEGMGDRAFYGGGYNGRRIDHNGRQLVMNNTQTGGWDATWEAPHNICIPFVVSASGYGLLFDDHYRGARLTPSADGTTYTSSSKAPIAYYYIAGNDGSMASVLENYTHLTGRQELPPYWALGYMTSRYGYKTQTESEEVVDNIKNMGLPLDAIVFDLYWQGPENSGMGNLDWYKPAWPDAQGMMSGFNSRGIKTICITEPFFTSVAATNYNDLKEKGYFADDDVSNMWWLGSDKVGLIDASNPEAMDWMWEFYKKRTREGVGGWWLDLGEPESHDNDSYHQGGTAAEVHNEFGNLWLERVHRGFKEEFPDVRPFLMPRAGTAGMQRHGAFPWSGDIRRSWDGLKAQIPALISSGMSGVAYMGSDVSGFANDNHTDSWLYRRWVQMAVFSPMMRTHSTYLPEPYHSCYSDIADDVKTAINMRYSYLPYTYTLAWENATKGTPLARPINFHDTEGTSVADCADQYLWGKDILVAPVVEFKEGTTGDESRRIVFPEGNWVDLNHMSKVYRGGSEITYDAPHSILPHFGRLGSFITRFTQDSYDHTGNIDNSRLTVTYLIDNDATTPATATLFDDDHVSTRTLEENRALYTTFTGTPAADSHDITISHTGSYEGMPASRRITFIIPGCNRYITGVSDPDGTEFRNTTGNAGRSDDDTYRIDGSTLTISATVPTTGSRTIRIHLGQVSIVNPVETAGSVFEYSAATGTYSYTLPEGTSGDITVHDLSGCEMRHISGLAADGTVHQASLQGLSCGVYMSTLTTAGADGRLDRRTIKTVVH